MVGIVDLRDFLRLDSDGLVLPHMLDSHPLDIYASTRSPLSSHVEELYGKGDRALEQVAQRNCPSSMKIFKTCLDTYLWSLL